MRSGSRRFLSAVVIFPITFLLLGSCMKRVHQVTYTYLQPVASKHYQFGKDSLQLQFMVEPKARHIVIPFIIFNGNKKSARITYLLYGKAVSAREYGIRYTKLLLWHDSTLIGRSTDPELFSEQVQRPAPKNAVTPLYGTGYKLKLSKPRKMNLTLQLDFEISHKNGLSETYSLHVPLKKIEQKSFSLFNPLE